MGAEEEHVLSYWADLQANCAHLKGELQAAEDCFKENDEIHNKGAEAVAQAIANEADAAYRCKQTKIEAENARCGNMATREEQAREKAAQIADRKVQEFQTQCRNILVAKRKSLAVAFAAREASRNESNEIRAKLRPVELMINHATPFCEWLAADDEDSAGDGTEDQS